MKGAALGSERIYSSGHIGRVRVFWGISGTRALMLKVRGFGFEGLGGGGGLPLRVWGSGCRA